jgi:hypothetical protein
VPLAGPDYHGYIAAGQFSAIKHGFKNTAGLRGQRASLDFLIGPCQDAAAQAAGLDQPLHEMHLIDTEGEKKVGECGKRFFA